ncbi:MAG: hypothetical protein ACXWXK_06095, partial [Actinomycetota bacterium]
TVSFGIAPILGAGIGGWVFETYGTTTLYVGASSLALAGGAMAWVAMSAPSLANREPDVEPVL